MALTSKYKSEFLANMSHELRTPLNSLLILSDQLSKNPDGNLSPKQTEYAKTIHSSGNDLLMLINDILDLSKIESGTVVLDVGELRFADLHNYVERTFRHVAEAKGVDFTVELGSNLPRTLTTDSKRFQQVIKNLLSNAFKFTHEGSVELKIELTHKGWHPENETLSTSDCVLAISVSDTGIGIPLEKQHIIFEAFQQADGSTSRKYGGTGLGLAISREIARLLGGEIGLVSRPGIGSTFTLYLPQTFVPQKTVRRATPPQRKSTPAPVEATGFESDTTPATVDSEFHFVSEAVDDRNDIQSSDRSVLIVDNDVDFARFVLETAHKVGFKGITTPLGAAAIALAGEYEPQAILLDISLPDISGWQVLDRLKHDVNLQHIPVYIVSTADQLEQGWKRGARGILPKPIQTAELLEEFLKNVHEEVSRPLRRILLLETDALRRGQLSELFADTPGIEVQAVGSEAALVAAVGERPTDAVVLGCETTDCPLASLAEQIMSQPRMENRPIIFHMPANLSTEQVGRLQRLAHEFNLELTETQQQLTRQLVSSLGIPVNQLSEPCRKLVLEGTEPAKILAGKKVLIVDDDIRNIFALTSILERYDMVTVSAENGRDAINLLQAAQDVDIVLMDIMMPEMDGLDTTRAIRQIARFRNLPIIAVTAKAMKGDREKCIEAAPGIICRNRSIRRRCCRCLAPG